MMRLDNVLTVAKIPNLIRSEDREFTQLSDVPADYTVGLAIATFRNDLWKKGYRDFVIVKNGHIISDMASPAQPGDFIAISPKHGFEELMGLIWMGLTYLGMSGTVATFVAGTLSAAIIIGGGMLVNRLMSPGQPKVPSQDADSPSYSIQGMNPVVAGTPVPVVYGQQRTVPPVIGSYRRAIDPHSMQIFFLLVLGAGETLYYPTADDVYIGEEKLTSFSAGYVFRVTSGKANPTTDDVTALSQEFYNIWHDRSFDRVLNYVAFNGYGTQAVGSLGLLDTPIDSSTTITIGVHTWTFVNSRTAAWQISIGETSDVTIANIASAINDDLAGDPATAVYYTASEVRVTAGDYGAYGNAIVFSTNSSAIISMNGSGYLGGTEYGADPDSPTGLYYVATNGVVNEVCLIFDFPYGKYYVESGVFFSLEVDIWLGYKRSGVEESVTWYKTAIPVEGTAISSSKGEIYLYLPTLAKYDIYIVRATADDPEGSTTQRSTCYLMAFEEVVNVFQHYPGLRCAVVGLMASDKISGSIPPISVDQNIGALMMPNWSDTGLEWKNPKIPYAAAYDAMTNKWYGAGISPTKLIQAAWAQWKDWTGSVGFGYVRAECNLVIDEVGNLESALKYIEEIGRAKVIQQGNYWSVAVDEPQTVVRYTFSSGNILKDSFSWESFEDPEKADAVSIKYRDKDKSYQWKTTPPYRASWYDSITTNPRVVTIELRGCNDYDQAYREAILYMQRTEMITRQGKFDTSVAAMPLQRGDLIWIVHPTNLFGFGGRLPIDHTAASTVQLDQVITLSESDYGDGKAVLFVVDYHGIQQHNMIMGPFDVATRAFEIFGFLTAKRHDSFAIGRPSEEKLEYQVLTKKFHPSSGDSKAYVEIGFAEYVHAAYFNDAYSSGEVAI
jgi:hypothetical protein